MLVSESSLSFSRLFCPTKAGNVEECKKFFETLYEFVYLQGTYLKPHAFSHPEAQMGFHPDAGASFYLSHLPGYLVATFGFWRHNKFIHCNTDSIKKKLCVVKNSERLAWIEERLSTLHTDDPSVIETSLAQYGDIVYPEKKSVLSGIDTIDRCFSHDTVEEIFDALEKEALEFYDEWCKITLKKLKQASPLSLKVTLQSIREGRFQSLDQCLVCEYRVSLTAMSKEVSNDFCEGVRARLVDRDFAPKWDPPSLGDVSKDMVDCYFSSRPEVEAELELPTAWREPYM